MRWTVITSDLMVFFPAAVWFVCVYCRGKAEGSEPWLLAMILLNPCLILIDHGHFQVELWGYIIMFSFWIITRLIVFLCSV